MLTRDRAVSSLEFHFEGDGGCRIERGPRGRETLKQVRVRRNGMTQVWKTRPTEFRIPVKYGIRARDQFSIHQYDAERWHAAEDCPLLGGQQ